MKMFRLFACLFTLVSLGLGFTACDDKEEKNVPVNESNIVGKWNLIHAEGSEKGPDVQEGDEFWEEEYSYGTAYLDLKADHTFQCVSVSDKDVLENGDGTWSLSNKVLTINMTQDGEAVTEGFKVKSLTKSQAVLEGEYQEGADESYVLMTLKK